MSSSPHLNLAHAYWKNHLRQGDLVIDATCGNGHDTCALAKLLLGYPESLLIGFDIQTIALQNTEALLKRSLPEEWLKQVLFERRCHSEIDQIPLPQSPKLVVYNLGYLPGGNKDITTQTETTLASLQKALGLLKDDGALSVTCYPGHEEGKREEEAILKWVRSLPSEQWQICFHQWINRKAAPSLLWIRPSTK